MTIYKNNLFDQDESEYINNLLISAQEWDDDVPHKLINSIENKLITGES